MIELITDTNEANDIIDFATEQEYEAGKAIALATHKITITPCYYVGLTAGSYVDENGKSLTWDEINCLIASYIVLA